MRERLIELMEEGYIRASNEIQIGGLEQSPDLFFGLMADYFLDNGVIVLQEDVLAELYNLIHDVNTAEISEQISADLLSSWTVQWRIAMKAKMAELGGKA